MLMIIFYIIVAIVIISLIIKFISFIGAYIALGGAQLLFNPRVSSVFLIILWIILLSTGVIRLHSPIAYILMFLIWIDCIRDIKLGDEFYDYEIDSYIINIEKFLIIKGLLSIATLGYARIIYLIFVYPTISFSVKNQIAEKIKNNKPLYFTGDSQPRKYYYEKDIYKLLSENRIVGISDVIAEELTRHNSKYQKTLPKKWIEKVRRKFKPDEKDALKARIESKMREAYIMDEIYMSANTMDKIAKMTISTLQNGARSPGDIANLHDFTNFEFGIPIHGTSAWGEFFIIKALKPFVERGDVIDTGNNVDDVDNHVYELKGVGHKTHDLGDIEDI